MTFSSALAKEKNRWLRQCERSWYVLRYYRPSQLTSRALKQIRAKMPRLGLRANAPVRSRIGTVRDNPGFRRSLQGRLDDRKQRPAFYHREGHQFTFLNESREFGARIDWECRSLDVPLLWRFHLHYHEFLLDLFRSDNGASRAAVFWEVVEDWIRHNRREDSPAQQAAWHPYCISRRLPIWMMAWSEFPPPQDQQQAILQSLHEQAASLLANLEWDLRGNHLLLDLTTLAMASLFLEGAAADNWRAKAVRLLRSQLVEQLLEHGEHIERSPMYHAQVLQSLLDVRDASVGVDDELEVLCHQASSRMARWLAAVLPPDGQIPLLSDGGLDECPEPVTLLRRVEVEKVSETDCRNGPAGASHNRFLIPFPPAGLHGDTWTWRDGNNFLLFDTGPVGPDWLPAHSHCDLLTIVASIDGQRLFVDSGTHDYSDGEMRNYCRSTRAHNVLQIDAVEQCDMWSRFRMGYRGWPKPARCGTAGDVSWCQASHNAYRRVGVPDVGRWVGCQPDGPWVCVDWAKGRGEHQLTHWLHLHPDVDVRLQSRKAAELRVGNSVCELRFLTDGELTLEQAWYCTEFGKRIASPLLNWTVKTTLPGIVAWSLAWNDVECNIAVKLSEDEESSLTWGQNHFRFMDTTQTSQRPLAERSRSF